MSKHIKLTKDRNYINFYDGQSKVSIASYVRNLIDTLLAIETRLQKNLSEGLRAVKRLTDDLMNSE